MVTSLARRDGCILVCRDLLEGALLSLPEMPLQGGMGYRQVLLDAPTHSGVSHCVALLLSGTAAVPADAGVLGV